MSSTSDELLPAAEVIGLCSSTARPRVLPGSVAPRSNATSAEAQRADIVGEGGERLGTIALEFESADHADPGAAPAAPNEFGADICRDLARLRKWAAGLSWRAIQVPELHVIVSDRFKISKSLVPAWSGRTGNMEFPLRRVLARQAAIMHELVHVFFPNGNRFLAEGLAIYLQAAMGGNPAFPNFGKPLHKTVRERWLEIASGMSRAESPSLAQMHLAELDAIATPGPLVLRMGGEVYGEDKRGQTFIYPIAGSFVQFLIETRGMKKFRTLYEQTPLVPLAQNAGSPDRWSHVYDAALANLERDWKAMIESGYPETNADRGLAAEIEA